jgi:hypothetical protein
MANKKRKKGLSQRQVGYIISGFGVLLLGGVVWAATVGQLQVSGSVNRGASADLDIISVSCINPTSGYGAAGVTYTGAIGGDLSCGATTGHVAGRVNGNNDRLDFGIYLGEPGASDTVQFYIKNVGAVDVDLSGINVTSTTGFTGSSVDNSIVLGGTYSDIIAQCIAPGAIIGPFSISATWPAGATSATGGAVFSAFIDYAQANC